MKNLKDYLMSALFVAFSMSTFIVGAQCCNSPPECAATGWPHCLVSEATLEAESTLDITTQESIQNLLPALLVKDVQLENDSELVAVEIKALKEENEVVVLKTK